MFTLRPANARRTCANKAGLFPAGTASSIPIRAVGRVAPENEVAPQSVTSRGNLAAMPVWLAPVVVTRALADFLFMALR